MEFYKALVIIITNFFILYFGVYGLLNLLFLIIFLHDFLRQKFREPTLDRYPKVSVLVPAFNEEKVIADTVNSLLNVDYPDLEIIVIDDGSTDRTTPNLVESFKMEKIDAEELPRLNTKPVRTIYRSSVYPHFVLIEKENGGKSDALNAGLNLARGEIVVTIDADTVLARNSLKRLVAQYLKSNAAAIGGLLTISNEVVFENGRPIRADVPKNPIVLFQLIEYLVSYTIGRVALSRLNSLLVLSGAFSAFDKKLILDIGGFLSEPQHGKHTVCEDMEIIVRLHKFLRHRKIKRKIIFAPFPVAWTEAPHNLKNVLKQRNRWHRGLIESLLIHRDMLFEPAYGVIGLFAMPYYLFFEFLAPFFKLISVIFLVLLGIIGLVHLKFVLVLFVLVIIISALYTAVLTTMIELKFKRISRENIEALRYRNFGSWLKLIVYSFFLEPVFGLLRLIAQLWGMYDFARGRKTWYKYERTGFGMKKPGGER